MEPHYVTFEQAKWLKEIGFDEKCSHYYIDNFQNFKYDGILYKNGLPYDIENENILQFVRRRNQHHLCNAPEHWQVVEWLRVNHGIDVWSYPVLIKKNDSDVSRIPDEYSYQIINKGITQFISINEIFDNPKEAYSAAFNWIKDSDLINYRYVTN
jgi:hypothetical protein